MSVGEVQEIEFSWRHDCPFNDLTEQYPGVTLRWETPAVGVDETLVLSQFELETPAEYDLDTATIIEELEGYESVVEVDPASDHLFNCLLRREMITMSPELLAECVAVTIDEHDGIEEWRVLTPSSRVERFLFERLEDQQGGEFELQRKVSLGEFGDRGTLREQLTGKQREALVQGLDSGYFEYPRESTAEDVAIDLGITASSYISRIRRGERRLIEAVFQDESE